MPLTSQLVLESPDAAVTEPARWITDAARWHEWMAAHETRRAGEDAWMSPLWLGTWWDIYHAGRELRAWVSESEPAVMCPLYRQRQKGLRRLAFLGYPGRRHALAAAEAIPGLVAALAARRDWDEITLDSLPGLQAELWRDGLRAHGAAVTLSAPWRQRYILLDRPWSQVEADFRPGLPRELDKMERQLAKSGPVAMRSITDPEGLAQVFDACLAIEASGWKGANGTALACDRQVQRFYRSLAFQAAERRQLWLALLYCGDAIVAFSLNLRHGPVLAGLKMSYTQAWRRFSPGKILLRRLSQAAQAAGTRELDLSGGDDAYKADWTPHARELVNLHAFNRTARGRLAELGQRLRRRLK